MATGQSLFERGDIRGALDCFESAARVEPRRAEAWYMAGGMYVVGGQARLAKPLFERALELQPEHPKALYRSAQAHTQLGQPAQAKAFLARLEAAAQGDEEMLKAAAQERARLEHRQERHKRQQKKAYARMVQGHDDAPRGPHRWWQRQWRKWRSNGGR